MLIVTLASCDQASEQVFGCTGCERISPVNDYQLVAANGAGNHRITTLADYSRWTEPAYALLARLLRYHPRGSAVDAPWTSLRSTIHLGQSVATAMHKADEVAFVAPGAPLKEVIIAMTRRPMGGACVVAGDGALAGFLTDGDLRRALTNHDDIRALTAADAMTATPVTIGPNATLGQALELMERRPSQISVLPVVDSAGRALGLLRIHDIYLGVR